MSLKAGVARGAFSLGGARIATNILNAGAIILLARLLTPEDFGIVAIASSVLSVVQSCTELSLGSALIQKDKVSKSHVDSAWTLALIRSLFLCAVFVVFSWPLSIAYSNPDLVPVFMVSGFTGAIAGMQNPMMALASKDMRFGPIALYQFSQKALSLLFAVVLALTLHSYWAIIAGNALGVLGAAIVSYLTVPYRPGLSFKYTKEIWGFSGWLFVKQLCETLNWRVDQIIIGLFLPKAQLGIYAMADNLAVIPARETIHPVRQALFPGLANLNGDIHRLKGAFLRAQASIAMITAPLGIGLALVAEPAVKIALGNQWLEAIPYVQIAALLYSFGTLSVALQPVAMALGRTRILFIQQLIALCIKLPLILGGLFLGGLLGAALGRCLSEFFSMLIEFTVSKILLGLSLGKQFAAHGMTFFGILAMAGGVLLVEKTLTLGEISPLAQLILDVLVGGGCYAGSIFVAWLALGRPDGAVTELVGMVGRMASMVRKRKAPGL